ncbi:MAG: hypothetical protein GX915_10045 [Clostridiales bacterium]|nr:hypothetical protein [Clostridiales bacterium]
MFVNFSNHPFERWEREQIEVAKRYGEILDIPFPEIPSQWSNKQTQIKAKECADMIMAYNPSVVMCQGEYTLTYQVVAMLKERGIKVVAACSERMVEELEGRKVIKFKFEQFREY